VSTERSFGAPPTVEDKQPWVYGSRGQILTIDGDDDQPTDIAEVTGYSFDLGLLLPINRVVFFPPEKGTTTGAGVGTFENAFSEGSQGQLYKDQYPRHYIVSASVNEGEFLRQSAEDFDTIVGSNSNHSQRIADVRFDTDFLRFIRLRFPVTGFIAEVKFFGEGFVPETRWVSQLFDMGEPVNFGRLHYDFEVYRSSGFGLEPELDPNADVRVEIELRTGRDDSPQIHHIVTEIGTETVVTEAVYNRAPSTYLGSGSGIAIPG